MLSNKVDTKGTNYYYHCYSSRCVHMTGEKVLPGTDGSPFAAAACELVQGFIPVSSE